MKALANMPFTIGKREHCSLRSVEDRDALVHQFRYVPPFVVKRLCRDENFHNLGRDDALSEGFLALVRAAELWRGDGEASFKTYACTAVRRRVVQALRTAGLVHIPLARRKGQTAFASHLWIQGAKGVDGSPTHDRRVEDADIGELEESDLQRKTLWEMVGVLPSREATVIRLSVQDGLDNARIGGVIGISKEGVRQILHRAVHRLQERVKGCGT